MQALLYINSSLRLLRPSQKGPVKSVQMGVEARDGFDDCESGKRPISARILLHRLVIIDYCTAEKVPNSPTVDINPCMAGIEIAFTELFTVLYWWRYHKRIGVMIT